MVLQRLCRDIELSSVLPPPVCAVVTEWSLSVLSYPGYHAVTNLQHRLSNSSLSGFHMVPVTTIKPPLCRSFAALAFPPSHRTCLALHHPPGVPLALASSPSSARLYPCPPSGDASPGKAFAACHRQQPRVRFVRHDYREGEG